jgi:heme oxygenase (biliverdin-producing, ferredoxin)
MWYITTDGLLHPFLSISDVHFKKSRLERTESLVKDLELFKEQGYAIPEPSLPGKKYSTYLTELATSSTPSFLCHYYNLYFAHATGGVGIGRQVVLTDLALTYCVLK